ncbi:hypothetical protein JCM9279_005522 [Rhodotorula babjevae]
MARSTTPPRPLAPVISTLRPRTTRAPLVRTGSSASIAGAATFAAAPPPLPSLDKRSLPTASSAPEPPPPRAGLRRRRPRLVAALVVAITLGVILVYRLAGPTTSLLYLVRFKLRDRAHDERWCSPLLAPFGLRTSPCALRKEPLVFVRGEGQAAVVWETTGCGDEREWGARLGTKRRPSAGASMGRGFGGEPRGAAGRARAEWEWRPLEVERSVLVHETEVQGARIVHTARIGGLRGGELYQYELHLVSSTRTHAVVRHAFPWLGPEVAEDGKATTLHVACVADNQYNLRTFRRALLRLLSIASSLPSRYFSPSALPSSFSSPSTRPLSPLRRPHLLLHAGDAAQNPHDLAQWQTDLWDVLTRGLSSRWRMGQKTPILLARGNHDWDATGVNAYTGGPWDGQGRGTYHALSPHARMRILVLDSNLPTLEEQHEQERWLRLEVAREEWRRASLRVVVVHTAPWIEWWDREAWTSGGESQWSAYVRTALLPLLARAQCTILLSGHSHAYTRGFLPYSLVPAFAAAPNSTAVSAFAVAAAREKGWERTAEVRERGAVQDEGMLLVTLGGAGGTLDEDRVEEWGWMGVSRSGVHHGGWIALSFAGSGAVEPPSALEVEAALAAGRRGEGVRVYEVDRARRCSEEDGEVRGRDVFEWRAVGVDGESVDRVFVVSNACVAK